MPGFPPGRGGCDRRWRPGPPFRWARQSRLLVDGRSIIVRQLDVLQRITTAVFIVANDADRLAAGQLRATDLGRVLDMTPIDEVELARFGPVDRLIANVNSAEDYARVQ